MKQVVITGVSTGIGYACVKMLLSREFRVYGSVRNQTDADRLQREFGERFVPLLFDVTDEEAVQAGAAARAGAAPAAEAPPGGALVRAPPAAAEAGAAPPPVPRRPTG